jgi:hypothetical protein
VARRAAESLPFPHPRMACWYSSGNLAALSCSERFNRQAGATPLDADVDRLAARRAARPAAGLLQLLAVLAGWFAAEGFPGSLVSDAAVELRGRPERPARPLIAAHHAWLHQFLRPVTTDAGPSPARPRAEQLHLQVDGADRPRHGWRRGCGGRGGRALAAELLTPGR